MNKVIAVLSGKRESLTKEERKSVILKMIMIFFLSLVTVLCANWLNRMNKIEKENTKSKTEQKEESSKSKTQKTQNQKNNSNKSNKGKERASKFSNTWKKADLKKSIKKFAGKKPKVSTTETGKTIYRNDKTGIQVVVDKGGKYFRIQDTKITGKRCYLDLEGKIPNNKMVNGKITGNSQAEYNQLTHFLFE